MPRVPASLRVLLLRLIDYAGLYPPAALPIEVVVERYRTFRVSPDAWMLNRLVLPISQLHTTALEPDWPVTLLVDDDPGALPAQIETLETKRPDLRTSVPVYHEAPLSAIVDGFVKYRTGGLTPEAIPCVVELANFLCAAAARRIPFKATAGLHHPIRCVRALTYDSDSPRAIMHGFVNVFVAATLAWSGAGPNEVTDVLQETAISAFRFDDHALVWRGRPISTDEIATARRDFAHSFGSCSFEEPVSELREAGLLP